MSVIEVNFSKMSPNEVLDFAKGELTEVLVLGTDSDGELYARSNLSPENTLWLIESFKNDMLNGALK